MPEGISHYIEIGDTMAEAAVAAVHGHVHIRDVSSNCRADMWLEFSSFSGHLAMKWVMWRGERERGRERKKREKQVTQTQESPSHFWSISPQLLHDEGVEE